MFGSRKNKPEGTTPEGQGPDRPAPDRDPTLGSGGQSHPNPAEGIGPDPADTAASDLDDLRDQLAQLQAERDALHDRYIRTLADYQNAQRRARIDQDAARLQGVRGVVANILTVLDHFDHALNVDTTSASAQTVVDGVRLIRDELMRVLTTHGVTLVSPAPGDDFDPHRHQAVLQETTGDVQPGRVTKTLQPGYLIGDMLVRPAMVVVRAAE